MSFRSRSMTGRFFASAGPASASFSRASVSATCARALSRAVCRTHSRRDILGGWRVFGASGSGASGRMSGGVGVADVGGGGRAVVSASAEGEAGGSSVMGAMGSPRSRGVQAGGGESSVVVHASSDAEGGAESASREGTTSMPSGCAFFHWSTTFCQNSLAVSRFGRGTVTSSPVENPPQ